MTVVDRYEQDNEPEHRIDPATLDWVRDEIESTIAQSTEALDAYAAAPTDPTPLRLTGSQLHQVGGTLQMVELDGAARLAGEVERLLDGIVRGDVDGDESALDLVRSGLNTLSSHLDDLRLGGHHIPLRLLPTINQLRVGRAAEPVDPLELFSPDLSISAPTHPDRVQLDDVDALQEVAESARRDFQTSLLTWLRNTGDAAPLDTMIDVLDRLWAHTRMPSAGQIWWIGAALVESFRDADKEIDKEAKSLLGRLDQRIRLLGDEGEAALVSDRAEDLAGRMLYEIALAENRGQRASQVAGEFRLRQLLGEDIDEAVETVRATEAYSDEVFTQIAHTRDAMMAYFDGDRTDKASLERMISGIDTLAVGAEQHDLGTFGELIREMSTTASSINTGEVSVSDQLSLRMAGSLLFIENTLKGQIDAQELETQSRASIESLRAIREGSDEAVSADGIEVADRALTGAELKQLLGVVAGEIHGSLGEVEEDLEVYVANPDEPSRLDAVPGKLGQAEGALEMLGQTRAAELVSLAGDIVERLRAGTLVPGNDVMDSIAFAIGGVQAYVDGIERDRPGLDRILDRAIADAERVLSAETAANAPESPSPAAPAEVEDQPVASSTTTVVAAGALAAGAAAAAAATVATDETSSDVAVTTASDVEDPAAANEDAESPVTENADSGLSDAPVETTTEALAGGLNACLEAWLADGISTAGENAEYRALRTSLTGVASLADARSDMRMGQISTEITNLLDIVAENPEVMCDEVEQTLRESCGRLTDLLHGREPAPEERGPGIEDALVQSTTEEPSAPSATAEPETVAEVTAPVAEPEQTPAAVAPPAPPSAQESFVDDDMAAEILEIYLEEAGEVVVDIDTNHARLEDNPADTEALKEVRRGFHTLKGSGRIAGVNSAGDLAWTVESLLNDILEGTVTMSPAVTTLIAASRQQIGEIIAGPDPANAPVEISQWEIAAEHARRGDDPLAALISADASDTTAEQPSETVDADDAAVEESVAEASNDVAHEQPTTEADDNLDLSADTLLPVAGAALGVAAIGALGASADDEPDTSADDYTVDADMPEQADAGVEAGVGTTAIPDTAVSDTVVVELEPGEIMLTSNAEDGVDAVESLSEPVSIESMFGEDVQSLPEGDVTELEVDLTPETEGLTEAVEQSTIPVVDDAPVAGATASLIEPSILEIFTGEATAHLAYIGQWLAQQDGDAPSRPTDDELIRAIHTLRGTSRAMELNSLAEVFEPLDNLLSTMDDQGREIEGIDSRLISRSHALAEVGIHALADGRLIPDSVDRELHLIAGETRDRLDTVRVDAATPDLTDHGQVNQELVSLEQAAEDAGGQGFSFDDFDLSGIFLEEAAEILERYNESLDRWRANGPSDREHGELLRELHTLKGGARTSGFTEIADLVHHTESLLEDVSIPELAANPAIVGQLEEVHDSLLAHVNDPDSTDNRAQLVELTGRVIASAPGGAPAPAAPVPSGGGALAAGAAVATAAGLAIQSSPQAAPEKDNEPVARIADPIELVEPESAALPGVIEDQDPDPLPEAKTSESDDTDGDADEDERDQTVRVSTRQLDNLVSYAGEASVSRSRVSQQFGEIHDHIRELDTNVVRFREQLRELEIQAETHMLARSDFIANEDDENFDPLEFDRFSRMQTLARTLSENLEDLSLIRGELTRFAERTEDSLQQQSHIHTELQEGLMRTRMVSFSEIVPRLRHIVRQTSRDLGKHATLDVQGADVEIDRNIVNRVVGPLEHMLRNAIDHGLESPGERAAAGKSETGEIRFSCRQDGSEIVMELADDGAGINTDAIRRKGIAGGFISETDELQDEELFQLLFVKGFSTADQLTQVSGRGVGMDVVHESVRQLGGAVVARSEPGKGTTFTLRLPMTLAITHALVIRVGAQRFAVPLRIIKNIVKVKVDDLGRLIDGDDHTFEYQQQTYPLMRLADNLALPDGSGDFDKVPILLLRVGASDVAVQVDEAISTEEIVVKPLGRQLESVPGIQSATVLGDGSVVLVLEMTDLWSGTRAVVLEDGDADESAIPVNVADPLADALAQRADEQALDADVAAESIDVNDDSADTVVSGAATVEEASPVPEEARVTSAPGTATGTPVAGGAPRLREEVVEPDEAEAVDYSSSEPPIVMVVDDSLTVRKVTERTLGRYNFETVLARDGINAMEMLEEIRPDIMLVDIEMPRMDGFELTRRVRGSDTLKDIPIVIITSRAGQRHRDKAISLGATEYLSKPYQEDQLVETICALVPHARHFADG